MLSVLSHLLLTERHRPRAARGGGFSVPAMMEREAPGEVDPVVVSNTRGDFVQTRKTSEGLYRFAFFPCPIEEEGKTLAHLFQTLWAMSTTSKWSNRYQDVREALKAMKASPIEPKTVVLPKGLAETFAGQALPDGRVLVVEGLHVLVAPLPERSAIVAAQPTRLGVYTRVGDRVGLQLYNVPQTLMLVQADDGMV